MPTTNEIYDKIGRVTTQLLATNDPEVKARLNGELVSLSERLPKPRGRAAQFSEEDEGTSRDVSFRGLLDRPAKTDQEREAANFADCAVILGTLLNKDPRQTKFWQRTIAQNAWMQRAMDTSAGGDWIPTQVSSELMAQVRLETRVVSQLVPIDMPSAVYKLPLQGDPPKAYLVSEVSGSEDFVDSSKFAKASDLGIGSAATLTARKVGVRVVPSVELTEDSIVPALPLITAELVRAMSEAQENACVNARRVGTLDSDVSDAADVRHWFDGFRQIATSAGAGNNQAVIAGSNPLTLENIRGVRSRMGKYALNPADCFWLTNSTGYNQMLSLRDANGNPIVATMEKWGDKATLVTGSIASLDGFGIILSQFVRQDLNHAGSFDGQTSDASEIYLVSRKQWVFGTHRTPTLRSRIVPETDQYVLVSMMRGDLACLHPTETPIGVIYDVRNIA